MTLASRAYRNYAPGQSIRGERHETAPATQSGSPLVTAARTRGDKLALVHFEGDGTHGCYVEHDADHVVVALDDVSMLPVQRFGRSGRPGTETVPEVVRVHPLPVPSPSLERFQVVQQWEGTVTELAAESFIARLQDQSDPSRPEEQAEFSVEEVDPDDRKLLRLGAVFYWSVGYHYQASGTRRLSNDLRFRRLPQWTRKDLARAERAFEFDNLFSYER